MRSHETPATRRATSCDNPTVVRAMSASVDANDPFAELALPARAAIYRRPVTFGRVDARMTASGQRLSRPDRLRWRLRFLRRGRLTRTLDTSNVVVRKSHCRLGVMSLPGA
jgi:hypothetical protein